MTSPTSKKRILPNGADFQTAPPAKGRKLQLLIDGSPASFALQNISEGGAMGRNVADLTPGAKVHVRFEGGILVPAVVKWAEDGLVGLAFINPVLLDRTRSAN